MTWMTRIGAAVAIVYLGGCIFVGPRRTAGSSCPPGHVWSDGQCHDKGKGHDPAHHGKGKKKR
jgi:hypothetical protein